MATGQGCPGFGSTFGCARARALLTLFVLGLVPTHASSQETAAAPAATEASPVSAVSTTAEVPALAVALLDASPPSIDADLPLYAAPTRLDRIGRILASVELNDLGPFRFVVDTGSNHTAISTRLARALGLEVDPGSTVEVHGVTGSAHVPVVSGMRLRVGEIQLDPRRLPVLHDDVFADADGFLGVEGLQDSRVEVDFTNDRVSVHRSTGKRAPYGYLVVPARFDKGGLLLARGRVGRVRVDVVVDTGAQYTIGNLALHRALLASVKHRDVDDATIFGSTPGAVPAVTLVAPTISLGPVQLRDVAVTFADLHVFSLWGLTEVPALVVGMDVLGTVDRFVVDYGRREFQLRPRGVVEATRRSGCSSGGCRTGSHIPR